MCIIYTSRAKKRRHLVSKVRRKKQVQVFFLSFSPLPKDFNSPHQRITQNNPPEPSSHNITATTCWRLFHTPTPTLVNETRTASLANHQQQQQRRRSSPYVSRRSAARKVIDARRQGRRRRPKVAHSRLSRTSAHARGYAATECERTGPRVPIYIYVRECVSDIAVMI